jgi:hypothetical protein
MEIILIIGAAWVVKHLVDELLWYATKRAYRAVARACRTVAQLALDVGESVHFFLSVLRSPASFPYAGTFLGYGVSPMTTVFPWQLKIYENRRQIVRAACLTLLIGATFGGLLLCCASRSRS